MQLIVRFDSPLITEDIDDKISILAAPFLSSVFGDRNFYVEVPINFQTDFASVPRLPLIYTWLGNKAKKPAVLHDYLYAIGETALDREIADNVLFAAMITNKNTWWERWLFFSAVRLFGGLHFKTRSITSIQEY